MAPGRPVKNITVTVPRHYAQRTGLKLAAEIKRQARSRKLLVDINMPHPELNSSIENASEWNSMLMSARADRGPQWDVGTQQFLVDEYSDLYYDPTPLLESIKKKIDEEKAEEQAQHAAHQHHQAQVHQMHQQQQHPQHIARHDSGHQEFHLTSVHQLNSSIHSTPSMPRHHAPGPGPTGQYPYPASPVGNMGMRPPPQPHGGSPFASGGGPGAGAGVGAGGGAPFNAIPPSQFYGANAGGSPARMAGMGPMNNVGGIGNMGNMAAMGNMGNMGNMGMAGMGGMGNMGNMGNMPGGMGGMGGMGNMGNMVGMGNVGNLGGMGSMGGPMGMIDGAGGMGVHPMGGMGTMGGGAGMPINLSPARRMTRGGFGDESFGLA